MTSFDSRLNPPYPIKECSSCGDLYIADYCCSNGSLVDKIICDPNKAPDFPYIHTLSSNKFHCFHCKDELGDGEVCKRCTYTSPPQISKHCCYGCGNPLKGIFCHQCTCELCGNGAYYGYNCPPKVLIIPDPEPFNHHTINELPPTVQGFDPKSDLVYSPPDVFSPSLQPPGYSYEFLGTMLIMVKIVHFKFRSPMIWNLVIIRTLISRKITRMIHMEMILTLVMLCQPVNQNFYNSNSPGVDQPQPSQSPVIHQPTQDMSIQEIEDLKQQYLDEMKRLINSEYRDEIKIAELKQSFNGMSIKIRNKEKLQQLEQVASLSTYPLKHFNAYCYDDDDEEDYTPAITPNEPVDSLIMEDEHLDTIPATESDDLIKSSVENLVPNPSESEDESECDVPDCDDSQTTKFSTFSNPLFDDSTSSDDESSHEDDIHEMSFKTYLNPLFDLDEESISTDCDPKEDIHLVKRLLYDNSSPRPPKEIDLSFNLDDPMPLGIEEDDDDSERDIPILEE
nr:hypothetical protein [Tanacetum cinerariifolium]